MLDIDGTESGSAGSEAGLMFTKKTCVESQKHYPLIGYYLLFDK